MNRTITFIFGALALIATIVMYKLGHESSHLSELKDFWYYPIPLVILAAVGLLSKQNSEEDK